MTKNSPRTVTSTASRTATCSGRAFAPASYLHEPNSYYVSTPELLQYAPCTHSVPFVPPFRLVTNCIHVVLNKCDLLQAKLMRGAKIRDSVPSFGDRRNDVATATRCTFRLLLRIPFSGGCFGSGGRLLAFHIGVDPPIDLALLACSLAAVRSRPHQSVRLGRRAISPMCHSADNSLLFRAPTGRFTASFLLPSPPSWPLHLHVTHSAFACRLPTALQGDTAHVLPCTTPVLCTPHLRHRAYCSVLPRPLSPCPTLTCLFRTQNLQPLPLALVRPPHPIPLVSPLTIFD